MAAITASMVAELRGKTDAPMMECKKALTEADGDMAKAEELLRVKLGTTQGGSRVRGEEGVARACREHHHLAFFEVLERLGADIGFHHLFNRNGRHHASGEALLVHGIGQGQRVHHGGQHAHVVSGCSVHTN